MNPAIKMGLWLMMAAISLALPNPWVAGSADLAAAMLYVASGLSPRYLIRDLGLPATAATMILAAYYAAYGSVAGGIVGALRIIVIFFPGAIVTRTTTVSQFVYSFRRILPQKLALALAISMRFLPYFVRELGDIIDAQRARGFRVSVKSMSSPEGMRAIVLPLAVRAARTADSVAMAVELRAFGLHPCRTYLQDALRTR